MRSYDYDSKPPVQVSGGVSVVGLLQVAFIILRLCNIISWNWWLVMLPTIIPIGLIILIVLGSIFIAILHAKDQ